MDITEEELKQRHEGKWIVVLVDGRYYVGDTVREALAQVPSDVDIKDTYHSPKKGELLLF